MPAGRLPRRDLLLKCAALGSLRIATPLGLAGSLDLWEEQAREPRKLTAWDELGRSTSAGRLGTSTCGRLEIRACRSRFPARC